MTTDNRSNEPSHNRITIRAFRDGEVSIIHEDQVLGLACTLDELKRAVATYEARAALTAAGVAPQEPSRLPDFFAPKPMPNSYAPAPVLPSSTAPQAGALPETGNELRDEDGDLISSGKHLRILQQGMYVCDTCTNSLGLNVRWDHAVKRNDHAPVLPSSGVDEDKLAEVIARVTDLWDDPLDEVHDIPQIARAVAEWLKGQGR